MVKSRRNRGVILTRQGLVKLRGAINELGVMQFGTIPTVDQLSEFTSLNRLTVSRILDKTHAVDRRSIERCFLAFSLDLTDEDYISVEAEKNLSQTWESSAGTSYVASSQEHVGSSNYSPTFHSSPTKSFSRRNRGRILTTSGLKKLRERIRLHELEENAGFRYTLERLAELTGFFPETVKNVLDCRRPVDTRTINRFFEAFGLTLENADYMSASQASVAPPDPNFIGRADAIADLNLLFSRNIKVIVIQAKGGVGKTTLARKYLQQEFGSFIEFPVAKETKDIALIEGLIEEKLRQLGEEPGLEFWVSLDRLKRQLQTKRVGVLIDNLEPALDAAGKFIEAHRRYVELLRVLSDPTVKSITLVTSRERLREADVVVQHYLLRGLNLNAWQQFFQSRTISIDTPALAALHNAYGGNAQAMMIVSNAILEDFSGDIEAYWQINQDDLFIERDLEDLVIQQVDRLQQLDIDAYNLLCRMGCYRYQNLPAIPIDGLPCLLWDVPQNHHRRVVKSLQDRSLVNYEDGKFYLHPVIRAEAIARLRESKDWKETNLRAAMFWLNSGRQVELEEIEGVFQRDLTAAELLSGSIRPNSEPEIT
jgi:GTPase SAR1 family protein